MWGRLRTGVGVSYSADSVRVRFGVWETCVPAQWVNENPTAKRLLTRECTFADALSDPSVAGLARLLQVQGCFAPVRKHYYTHTEVRAIFDAIRFPWYAEYYAHPVWNSLRTGAGTRNELVAWMLHNYHVSRAAGIVAARMASSHPSNDWVNFFRQDALDEYWHCDAFYFINAPNLRITADDAKAYVPLPSSLAFEQHTLQLAVTDRLAHVLTAYFQESSIAFESDSSHFYQEVERAYEIPSFFQGWKQHIRIDIEEQHADGISQLLSNQSSLDCISVNSSIRNSWLSFFFLRSALDDIGKQGTISADVLLRLPDANEALGISASLIQALRTVPSENTDVSSEVRHFISLCRQWSGVRHFEGRAPAAPDLRYLLDRLSSSAFLALSFSKTHDEIMSFGRIARVLAEGAKTLSSTIPHSPWVIAIANFLFESAVTPRAWLLHTLVLDRRVNLLLGENLLSVAWPRDLARALITANVCIERTDIGTTWLATPVLQLNELIDRWLASSETIPQDLLS